MILRPSPASFVTRTRLLVAVAGVLALVAVGLATRLTLQRSACRSACEARGYADARYTSAGRNGTPARCHCLTADEAAMRSRIPLGTEIPLPPGAEGASR